MNIFGSYSSFDPSGLGQFDIFLTDVIKVDNTEVLRLSLEHIHVLLVFSVFPLKLLLYGQIE